VAKYEQNDWVSQHHNQDLKKKLQKYGNFLLEKDKEISCLRKQCQCLLNEVKQLKRKDISIPKFDKETLTNLVESTVVAKVKVHIVDRENLTNAIKV
jgi:hypothetical protein